jgi:hypothetical protein
VLHLPAPPISGVASGHTCLNYGRSDHFAREYTALKKNAAQGHATHPPHGLQKVVIAKTGRVNYTAMEDIPEGEQVLAGMFSLNEYLVVTLFISGAKACTQRC